MTISKASSYLPFSVEGIGEFYFWYAGGFSYGAGKGGINELESVVWPLYPRTCMCMFCE